MRQAWIIAIAVLAALAVRPALAHEASVELPVGDGHVTDHPQAGNVYACRMNFRGGGARHTGDWFHGDTWNPAEKPHVKGEVYWPQASISMKASGDDMEVQSNGLPVKEPTGKFPISPSDPAYQYDTNPNAVKEQSLSFSIPLYPVEASEPSCLGMGMIGFTVTGVALYNALDDAGRDAAAHEVQDICDGHPQGRGQYHYHSSSPCLPGATENKLVGWALDGYPIFGMKDASGKLITNADLDACHGRAEKITIDGRAYDYAYRLTREYPYTLGCYHGQLRRETLRAIHQGMGPPRDRGMGPPPDGGMFGRPPF